MRLEKRLNIQESDKLDEAPKFTGSSFKLPWQVQDALDEGDYEEAWKYTESSSFQSENPGKVKERVQNIIIDALANDLGITDGKPVFRFICQSIGISEKDNPFIHYVESYPHVAGYSKDIWVTLNNLYADSVIDPEDLIGKEDAKTEMLLYDDSLFTNNKEGSDLAKVVTSFVRFPRRYGKALKDKADKYEVSEMPAEDKKALQADIDYISKILSNFKNWQRDPKMTQWMMNRGIIDKNQEVINPQGEGGARPDLYGTLVRLKNQWKKELNKAPEKTEVDPNDVVKQKRHNIFYNDQGQVRPWIEIEGLLDRLANDLGRTKRTQSA